MTGEEEQGDGPFVESGVARVVGRIRPLAGAASAAVSPELALAWNVHQPGVTSAIAGSRNPEHVRTNAAAGDIELDDVTLEGARHPARVIR